MYVGGHETQQGAQRRSPEHAFGRTQNNHVLE
jgi:hypothetical protein